MPKTIYAVEHRRTDIHPDHWLDRGLGATNWYLDEDPRHQMVELLNRPYPADIAWVIVEPAPAVSHEFTRHLEEAVDIATAQANKVNWDGYGAAPVSPRTAEKARAFARSLPVTPLIPDVIPHPDGDIAFEWWFAPDCVLTVTIGSSELVHHASLIGRAQNHGKEEFTNVLPHPIRLQLDRVLEEYHGSQQVDAID